MSLSCIVCGKRSYSEYCVSHKPRKPIKTTVVPKRGKRPSQLGKRGVELSDWVRDVARPYLIEKYGGETCNVLGCYATSRMDVDHIINKGSHPELRMNVQNVQFLCRPHHLQKTEGKTFTYRY